MYSDKRHVFSISVVAYRPGQFRHYRRNTLARREKLPQARFQLCHNEHIKIISKLLISSLNMLKARILKLYHLRTQ